MAKRRYRRLAKGIRQRGTGAIEGYFEHAGKTITRCFPHNTPLAVIKTWRLQEKSRLRTFRAAAGSETHTLTGAIEAYLPQIAAQVSFGTRKRHLLEWETALGGHRLRVGITAGELQTVMQEWLRQGASPATVVARRAALKRLWTVIDGSGSDNPVMRTTPPRIPPPPPRGLPYDKVTAILAEMRRDPREHAVCAVMAWTGLPGSQLKKLRPHDILWSTAQLKTPSRVKGQGAAGRVVPLLPQGLKALRQFHKLRMYGRVDDRKVRHRFKAACDTLGIEGVRVYDLRHSFGTLIWRATGDISTTAYLMGHTGIQNTMRYTLSAAPRVALDAIRRTGELVGHLDVDG